MVTVPPYPQSTLYGGSVIDNGVVKLPLRWFELCPILKLYVVNIKRYDARLNSLGLSDNIYSKKGGAKVATKKDSGTKGCQ